VWRRAAAEVAVNVKRHVDGIDGVDIEYDSVCVFCGETWEVQKDNSDPGWPKGKPLCCDEAVMAWETFIAEEKEKTDGTA
jgi:hypothetical protein